MLLSIAGCSSTLAARSTQDTYQDLMTIRLISFSCSGSTLFFEPGGRALEQRLTALRPWLETARGAGEHARMEAHMENQLGTLDVIRCATEAKRARSLAAYRRRVEELERRSRQRP
jgi:hypothetical protein